MLGTGSPLPDAERAGPAQLVSVGGRHLLIDCGRACVMRLAAAGVVPLQLDGVLLTHLHSDHVTDFNDVLTTQWIATFAPRELPVVGPPGTSEFVQSTLTVLAPDIGWRLEHHDDLSWEPMVSVTEALDGVVFDDGTVRVLAAPTEHKPVHPTVGYRVESDGRAIVLAGDSVPCESLDRLCEGADVYVQTVIRDDLIDAIGIARLRDVLDYHSTVIDAARTAARAGVGRLVLNHCVPAVSAEDAQAWIDIARTEFDGEVLLPSDLDRVST